MAFVLSSYNKYVACKILDAMNYLLSLQAKTVKASNKLCAYAAMNWSNHKYAHSMQLCNVQLYHAVPSVPDQQIHTKKAKKPSG